MHMKWQIADCLASFYRPNFETLLYPYCPTHIERPKEVKKLFLVNLPERAFLTVRLPPAACFFLLQLQKMKQSETWLFIHL